MDGIEDEVLLKLVSEGDVHAFAMLYKRYFRGLYGYCLQFAKSRHDAQDMVQDLFVKLWDYRRQLRPDQPAKGLLFSMAKNALVDAYRRQINAPIYEDYLNYCNSIGEQELMMLEYQEFSAIIAAQIDSLPTAQGRVMRMSRFENMTVREIADRLDVSEQTVKNQITQALRVLREKIKVYLNGPLLIAAAFIKDLLGL